MGMKGSYYKSQPCPVVIVYKRASLLHEFKVLLRFSDYGNLRDSPFYTVRASVRRRHKKPARTVSICMSGTSWP